MNNKRIGTEWEQRMVDLLSAEGYWVHFIVPDYRGAQPFDIIAVRKGRAMAIECKTLADSNRYFSFDRLEANQKLAFRKWEECGNSDAYIAVLWRGSITMIPFKYLEQSKKINMEKADGIYRRQLDTGERAY